MPEALAKFNTKGTNNYTYEEKMNDITSMTPEALVDLIIVVLILC